ncbi:MAG: hypothetical protein Q7S87_04780 [Agitococcus sp.]|nr:hypothetical protein [Agitococcus sp.]
MKFRKKPVVIEAVKWTGENLFEIITFISEKPDLRGQIASDKWHEYKDIVKRDGLIIKTLEGQHIANIGDWIIKGVQSEFYPCKPDIFEATYESV